MSQSQKKSGAHNISDLKARLGLKKGGPAGTATPPGGIVAPPGVAKQRGAVPAPPGAKQPEPPRPSVSDDPFAAMNAMAAASAVQRAPEIIIVNDGKPVESVERQSPLVKYGKYAGIVAAPLILGLIIGQIASGAKLVNRTIEDSGVLRDDIKRLRRESLQPVQDALLSARGQGSFKTNDQELLTKLKDKAIKPQFKVDPYQTYLYHLEPGLAGQIMDFYNNVDMINKLVEEHVTATENDAKAMQAGETQITATQPDDKVNRYLKFNRYGVIIDIPSKDDQEKGLQFGARLVEIGPPICQDGKPSTTGKCQDAPRGFSTRTNAGAGTGWDLTELGLPQGATIGSGKVLPLVNTDVFNSLAKGPEATVAERAYFRRLADLSQKVTETIELGSQLEGKLDTMANQGKRFTFFM